MAKNCPIQFNKIWYDTILYKKALSKTLEKLLKIFERKGKLWHLVCFIYGMEKRTTKRKERKMKNERKFRMNNQINHCDHCKKEYQSPPIKSKDYPDCWFCSEDCYLDYRADWTPTCRYFGYSQYKTARDLR